MKDGKFYVVNLDRRDGGGTHWVSVSLDAELGEYFDSYGCYPPEQVLKKMKECNKTNIMNLSQYQPLNSNMCGYYVAYVLDRLADGNENFEEILDHFNQNDQESNDRLVGNFWTKNLRQRKNNIL
jgi:hypothetical protein